MKLIRLLATAMAGAAPSDDKSTIQFSKGRHTGLQVKGAEHEVACRFDLRLDDPQPGGPPRLKVASSSVIDSQWVTRQRIPALGRRVVMTCSLSLEPDM